MLIPSSLLLIQSRKRRVIVEKITFNSSGMLWMMIYLKRKKENIFRQTSFCKPTTFFGFLSKNFVHYETILRQHLRSFDELIPWNSYIQVLEFLCSFLISKDLSSFAFKITEFLIKPHDDFFLPIGATCKCFSWVRKPRAMDKSWGLCRSSAW